jgi:hypothetical protein
MLNHSEVLDGLSPRARNHAQLLISVADGMRALCVGRTKLYELISAGDIELVKIGAKSCLVVASIEAYVGRLRAAASKQAA